MIKRRHVLSSRAGNWAAIPGLAALVAGALVLSAYSGASSSQGRGPDQPIAFPHPVHVQKLGMNCLYCHNAANNGQNVNGALFDVGASRPEFGPGKAVYTFQERATLATVQSTDPGRGIRSGLFADLNKFKTPNLRGLASRAPYFHNGIAGDLRAVVRHYEAALGFEFTRQEEADLVAFLAAL